MPEPTMPPMTIMVASNKPRRRTSVGWCAAGKSLMIQGSVTLRDFGLRLKQWNGESRGEAMKKQFAAIAVIVLGLTASGMQAGLCTIRGTITDPSGAAIPGATVVVKNVVTYQERAVT